MHRMTLPNTWFRGQNSLDARTTTSGVDNGKQLRVMGGYVMSGESRTTVPRQMGDSENRVRELVDYDSERARLGARPAYDQAMLDLPVAVRAIAAGILYLALLLLQDRIPYHTPLTAVTAWSLYLFGSTLIVGGIAREVASS